MKSPLLPNLLIAGVGLAFSTLSPTSSSAQEPGIVIADLARASEGRTFGKGECWDFAAALLDQAGCAWERPFAFGKEIDPKKDTLRPGDILQFDSAKIEWKRGNQSGVVLLGFPHHTAIVLSAKGTVVQVAHQNYNQVRRVTKMTLDLKDMTAGKWTAYRPVRP